MLRLLFTSHAEQLFQISPILHSKNLNSDTCELYRLRAGHGVRCPSRTTLASPVSWGTIWDRCPVMKLLPNHFCQYVSQVIAVCQEPLAPVLSEEIVQSTYEGLPER